MIERLEERLVPSAAQDLIQLTALRNDPAFAGIDGAGANGASDVGIAIIDSGVFGNHPELKNNFVAFYDAIRGIESSSPLTESFDPDGHGSHVAGIAASSNPAIGAATGANLIGIRALLAPGEAAPPSDPVQNALLWVLRNKSKFNIEVVNMSLGTFTNLTDPNTAPDPLLYRTLIQQLESIGVTVVASSGNFYADFVSQGVQSPHTKHCNPCERSSATVPSWVVRMI